VKRRGLIPTGVEHVAIGEHGGSDFLNLRVIGFDAPVRLFSRPSTKMARAADPRPFSSAQFVIKAKPSLPATAIIRGKS
jgi:hypothetical protein